MNKILIALIMLVAFCLSGLASNSKNSWKTSFPDYVNNVSSIELENLKKVYNESLNLIEKKVPINLNDNFTLTSISLEKDTLNIEGVFNGSALFFLYSFDENKGEFNFSESLSPVESLKMFVASLNSDDIKSNYMSYPIFYVETGKTVRFVYNCIDIFASDSEKDKYAVEIMIFPDGSVSEPDLLIMENITVTEIEII